MDDLPAVFTYGAEIWSDTHDLESVCFPIDANFPDLRIQILLTAQEVFKFNVGRSCTSKRRQLRSCESGKRQWASLGRHAVFVGLGGMKLVQIANKKFKWLAGMGWSGVNFMEELHCLLWGRSGHKARGSTKPCTQVLVRLRRKAACKTGRFPSGLRRLPLTQTFDPTTNKPAYQPQTGGIASPKRVHFTVSNWLALFIYRSTMPLTYRHLVSGYLGSKQVLSRCGMQST